MNNVIDSKRDANEKFWVCDFMSSDNYLQIFLMMIQVADYRCLFFIGYVFCQKLVKSVQIVLIVSKKKFSCLWVKMVKFVGKICLQKYSKY